MDQPHSAWDVVVIGGGTAGVMAGIAAAREGARTLIVERSGSLGGNAATGMNLGGFFDGHEVKLMRVLTDRGSEYCGNPERHEYELYLAVEDVDHTRTKTKSPQTNGICERFHKTVLNEFYRVAFRKKVYRAIDELQADLDAWITEYNEARPHQGRWCFGKTPMQTFLDAMPMTKEKMIAA